MAEQNRAERVSIGIILALTVLLGGAGYFMIRRQSRLERRRYEAERRYFATQAEFTEVLQVTQSEQEAHILLRRHVERSVPESSVVVLNRNNSDDRLEAATALPAGSVLTQTIEHAEPRSCLAVRFGRPQAHSPEHEPLVRCQLCGATGTRSTCLPLLVSGEVIGSVLVEHPEPLADDDSRRVSDSIAQAAPALANLRNLALAERRAMTDSLTGLPNRRAMQDTLRRMFAQADRTGSALAAVMLDLDHFQRINDTLGHDVGDDALAAVDQTLRSSIRTGDFAARNGGEEFVLLLPDTGRDGATVLAQKLRLAIAAMVIPGVQLQVTASLGVAAFPDDADDVETLLRLADHALYRAKERGRDRVEIADIASEDAPRKDFRQSDGAGRRAPAPTTAPTRAG